MPHSADVPAWPVKAGRRDVVEFEGKAVIGAAGAISSSVVDPGVTITKDAGTGVYNLTYPVGIKGRLYVGFKSAAGTIKGFWIVTFDPTAGTAQVSFGNGGGTATNPADGDHIWFTARIDSRVE